MGVDVKGFFSHLVDKEELFFYGLEDQPFDQGTYGLGEIAPNVRVTAINGILNDVDSCMKTVDIFLLRMVVPISIMFIGILKVGQPISTKGFFLKFLVICLCQRGNWLSFGVVC